MSGGGREGVGAWVFDEGNYQGIRGREIYKYASFL